MKKNSSYEEKLKRLMEINTELKKASLPMDDLIKLFEEGVVLFKDCNSLLDSQKLKVEHLIDNLNLQQEN